MDIPKTTLKYDERRHLLIATTITKENGRNGEYVDTFDEEGIRKLYASLLKDKKELEDLYTKMDKNLADMENQLDGMGKDKLTKSQLQLMEDLKVLKKVEPRENLKTQIKQLGTNFEAIEKELKEKKGYINDVKSKVKFKLD